LRLLESNTKISQRNIGIGLGVKLGTTNFCLNARLGKGTINYQNHSK
jgi:hypothetical protein